jgi:hypothetical protein
MREETNRVIRKYRTQKDFFFKLTLANENLDKLHFSGERMRKILDFMIKILGEGIFIGPNQGS